MKEYSLFDHFNRYLADAHRTRMSEFAAAGEFIKQTYLKDLVITHCGQKVTNSEMISLLTKAREFHDYMFHACGNLNMEIRINHEYIRDFCAEVLWAWSSNRI